MKNKLTALLMAAVLSLSLVGTTLAFDPPPSGETKPSVDENGNITWEIDKDDPTPPSIPSYPTYTPSEPSHLSHAISNGSGNTENGSWTTDPSSAKKGDTVIITVNPADGYQGVPMVRDEHGNTIPVSILGDNKYSFTMPDGQVSVSVEFTPVASPIQTNSFVDVKRGDYFYDAVLWAVENDITSGTSATTFSPDECCTRAQIVTFLWRAK